MIPLLARFWPYLIAMAALAGAVLWFSHSRYQAGYEAAQATMAVAVRKAEAATAAAEAKAHAITEAKDREWQTERNALQGRVTDLLSRPAPAIRLCKPAASRSEVPAVPSSTGQPARAASDAGPALQAGDDLGPALVRYGGDCERLRRQLMALQSWVAEQAQ
jgi:hypothetical protein